MFCPLNLFTCEYKHIFNRVEYLQLHMHFVLQPDQDVSQEFGHLIKIQATLKQPWNNILHYFVITPNIHNLQTKRY